MSGVSTNIRKQLAKAMFEGALVRGNQNNRGNWYYTSGFAGSGIGPGAPTYKVLGGYYSGLHEYPVLDRGLHIFTLNLSDTSGLAASNTKMPVYNSDMSINSSAIIGYAGGKKSVSQTIEGVVDNSGPANMLDANSCGMRVRFDSTNGNGTFNVVAYGCNPVYARFDGFAVARDLSTNSDANGVGYFGWYIMPGVTGITGATDILIGEASADTALVTPQYRYDFATGAYTAITSSDSVYSLNLGKGDDPQVYYNSYLYILDRVANKLRRINPSTLAETSVSINLSSNNTLFQYNGYIYTYYNQTFYAYDPTTLASVSGQNFSYTALSLPTEMTYSNLNIANYGSSFVLADSTLNAACVCTNIKAVSTTMTDFHFGMNKAACYPITINSVTYPVHIFRTFLDDWGVEVRNGTTSYPNIAGQTLKCSMGWWGNMLGYQILDTAQTKSSGNVIYVSFDITES